MNKQIQRISLSLVLAFIVIVSGGQTSRARAAEFAQSPADLLAMLPPSDAVAFIDVRRLHDAMPRLLAESPDALAGLNAHLDRFRETSGFDLRLIDGVALGFSFSGARNGQMVGIARGRFEANEATMNRFLRGAQRRTESDNRAIYVRGANAVAALDANTVVFGNLESVRAVAGQGRVENDLIAEATRTGDALAGFAMRMPPAPANSNSDEHSFFRSLAAVRQVSGAFSTTEGGALEVRVKARTENADIAREISAALLALKQAAERSPANGGGTSVALPGLGLIVSSGLLVGNMEVATEGSEITARARFTPSEVAAFVRALSPPPQPRRRTLAPIPQRP